MDNFTVLLSLLATVTTLLMPTVLAKANCVAGDIGRITCYDIGRYDSNYAPLTKELDESRRLPDVSLEIYRSTILQIPASILKDRCIWRLVLNGNGLSEVPASFLTIIGENLTELYLANNAITSVTSLHLKTFQFSKQLLSLDLSGNLIKTIDAHSFSEFTNLRLLDLKKNALTAITANTFQGLQSLTSLYLQHNKIQELQPRSFPNLTKLTLLDLENNRILTLRFGVFNDMANLKNLSLKGNLIRDIERNAFQNALKLTILSLASNQIRHLDHGAFGGLSDNFFALFELKDNLFHCLCKLQWLQTWLATKFYNRESEIDARCKLPYPAPFAQIDFCLVP